MWHRLLPLLSASWFLAACGTNLYKGFVEPKSDRALLEEARVRIDAKDYEAALSTLDKIKHDSNELRLLRSSANLGFAGLDMWSIITDLADNKDSASSSAQGADSFFNQVSESLLGEGETRTQRITALSSSVTELVTAPDPSASRVKNLACFLAGMMALPVITDATAAIQNTTSSLAALAATVDVSNPNAACPDLSGLNNSLTTIAGVENQFSLILAATADCKLLDLSGSASSLNAIEARLAKFDQTADAGCAPSPACGSSAACQALGLQCVYAALTNSPGSTSAKDGSVSSCELVQNCLTPGSCF